MAGILKRKPMYDVAYNRVNLT